MLIWCKRYDKSSKIPWWWVTVWFERACTAAWSTADAGKQNHFCWSHRHIPWLLKRENTYKSIMIFMIPSWRLKKFSKAKAGSPAVADKVIYGHTGNRNHQYQQNTENIIPGRTVVLTMVVVDVVQVMVEDMRFRIIIKLWRKFSNNHLYLYPTIWLKCNGLRTTSSISPGVRCKSKTSNHEHSLADDIGALMSASKVLQVELQATQSQTLTGTSVAAVKTASYNESVAPFR